MRTYAVPFAVLFAATLAAQDDAALAALCQQIAPAIQGDLTAGKPLPMPSADQLAPVADLLRSLRHDAAKAPMALFAVTHAWPEDDDAEALLARVPVGDAAGRQIVLIASRDGQIRGGALVDAAGALVAEGTAFVAQFAGKNLPAASNLAAPAAVAKRIAEFEQGKDATSRANAALVDLRRHMVAQAQPSAAILQALEHGEAPTAAQVAATREAYAAMQKRSGDLAPVLGKVAKDYDRLVAETLAHLDGLAQAGDAAQRQAARKLLNGSCRDCHQLTGEAFPGGFEEFAANERLRLGLGAQSFLVGYDVAAAGLDVKVAQQLADACCRAAAVLAIARE